MRSVIGIFLLASATFAGEPGYSWRTQASDPERVYLYLDGKQVGGWCYTAKHYRAFDGTNWGPPTDAAPVKPPANRVVVIPQPNPVVIAQPSSAPVRLRGPLRVRAATVFSQAVMDMTMFMFEEAIPRAIADSLAKGQYQLEYKFSVTRPPQPPAGQATPPSAGPPPRSSERRGAIPRS